MLLIAHLPSIEHRMTSFFFSFFFFKEKNVSPLRVPIFKADGFVSTFMEKFLALPLVKIVMFTTSMDRHAAATTKVVVGIPPKGEDNILISELVPQCMTRRPPYKGYFQRETDGRGVDRGGLGRA